MAPGQNIDVMVAELKHPKEMYLICKPTSTSNCRWFPKNKKIKNEGKVIALVVLTI